MNARIDARIHESEVAICAGLQVPIVIRGPGGVGRQLGAEHSQRLESYFQSIPGVQLVACSTVANAKALLKSAIRSDNPIIFFEHVLLYNVKGASLILRTSLYCGANPLLNDSSADEALMPRLVITNCRFVRTLQTNLQAQVFDPKKDATA